MASVMTNNSNLREATQLNMNQAFVNLNQGIPNAEEVKDPIQIAHHNFGYTVHSQTHTDSAGGEAFCNDDAESGIDDQEKILLKEYAQ